MVKVGKSRIHGKGAFSTQRIAKGTELCCDVIPLSSSDPGVAPYLFPYRGNLTCIHLGFASFLNGSPNPNLSHVGIDTSTNISTFVALRDIEPLEELTLGYSVPDK